jgi:hypothetical protein
LPEVTTKETLASKTYTILAGCESTKHFFLKRGTCSNVVQLDDTKNACLQLDLKQPEFFLWLALAM